MRVFKYRRIRISIQQSYGVMKSVLTSYEVDSGFNLHSNQSKDYITIFAIFLPNTHLNE